MNTTDTEQKYLLDGSAVHIIETLKSGFLVEKLYDYGDGLEPIPDIENPIILKPSTRTLRLTNDPGQRRMNVETQTPKPEAQPGSLHWLVRPLPNNGVADCPKCKANQSVKQHNGTWSCWRCGYTEIVDDDREAQRSNARIGDSLT